MKILHVNQMAGTGGAAGNCLALHNALLGRGQESGMLVGRRKRNFAGVGLIENDRYRSVWGRLWMYPARWLSDYSDRIPGARRVSERWLPHLASPARLCAWWGGREEFDFPGTRHLLDQAPFRPDVLHLHNLHGDYFDLRELPRLSLAVPTLITLRDAWLLAGHCAHSFDCERWQAGCGSCPGLDISPPLRRDGTAFNWRRKRDIYRQSRLWLAFPSQWLADKARQSILMPGAVQLKVIPNGVDTAVFKPGDKTAARVFLHWPQNEFIVIFAAVRGSRSPWRDYRAMEEAIRVTAQGAKGKPVRFFAIGQAGPPERVGAAKIEFLPYQNSMARCYQAADVYLHGAKADTFPTTVLEALACGRPVVATSVGGIPEQVIEGQTGFLAPAGGSECIARHLLRLLREPELGCRMGEAAAIDANRRFSLTRTTDAYVALYEEILHGPDNPKRLSTNAY